MAIFTPHLKTHLISVLIDDMQSNTSNYYVGLARHNSWPADPTPSAETEDDLSENLDLKKRLILGKKITPTDISYMFTKKTWIANTVYDQYDHRDPSLGEEDFYVINSSNDVYKCLFNNNGARSTVEPTALTSVPFEVADDGYIWKYMFTTPAAYQAKFATDNFSPVVANTEVVDAAVDGGIHVILVEGGGSNYKSSNGAIQSVVSNTVFQIDSSAVSTNGYYTDSALYIKTGAASGNLSIISNYHVNSTGKFVTVSNGISADLTSTYLISPHILIEGDGEGAKAYCTINTTTGAISTVKMIDPGEGYRVASVSAIANTGANAELTAIISPDGGHGSNPETELFSNILGISVQISGSEADTVPVDITFRQACVIHNPIEFGSANVYTANTFNALCGLTLSSLSDDFTIGETVEGTVSGATGSVVFANTSFVYLNSIVGEFSNNDILVGEDSSSAGVVSDINNSDIEPYSGKIFFYSNLPPVTRSRTEAEIVKVLIRY